MSGVRLMDEGLPSWMKSMEAVEDLVERLTLPGDLEEQIQNLIGKIVEKGCSIEAEELFFAMILRRLVIYGENHKVKWLELHLRYISKNVETPRRPSEPTHPEQHQPEDNSSGPSQNFSKLPEKGGQNMTSTQAASMMETEDGSQRTESFLPMNGTLHQSQRPEHRGDAEAAEVEQPREFAPVQRPKRGLLNTEPVSQWGISDPVLVALDFGAYKKDGSISSVGLNALDSRNKQHGMTSIQWMKTSDTIHWQVKEAFDGSSPPPHYRLRYGHAAKVRRADVKVEFRSYLQRFRGRNVILTFHDYTHDFKRMRKLGMDPFSIDGVYVPGWFDTKLGAGCMLENPSLRVSTAWIGYSMVENEWHNSANDAFNTNRLAISMIYGLHASAGKPEKPWPKDGVFLQDYEYE